MTSHGFIDNAGGVGVLRVGDHPPDLGCRSAELLCIPRVPFALVLPG